MAAAPVDTSVKAEPLEPPEKQSEGATSSPKPPPPPSITIKSEVKKEEPANGKDNDVEADDPEKPCTKMTMRLRRNLNNPQFVSRSKTHSSDCHSLLQDVSENKELN